MARALQEHSMPAIVQQLEVLGPFMKEGAQLASAVSGFVATMQVGRGFSGVAARGLPINHQEGSPGSVCHLAAEWSLPLLLLQ